MVRNSSTTNVLSSSAAYNKNTCTLICAFTVKNTVPNYETTVIGTLPTTLLPAHRNYTTGIIQGSTKAVVIDITASGEVIVWGYGANEIKAGSAVNFGATYIIR